MNPDSPYVPPSSAVGSEAQPVSPVPRRLALWSVLLILVPFVYGAFQMSLPAPGLGSYVMLAIGITVFLCILGSFVTGILALLMRRGSKGVLIPAVSGVVLSAVVIAMSAGGFLRARERALARVAEANRAAEARRNEQVLNQALAGTKTSREEPQSPISIQMERAAAQLIGKEAVAMRAAAEFTAKVEEAGRARLSALEKLKVLGPFHPGGLRTHVALTQRREALKRLIAADEASAALYAKSDSFFQETLAREQFTDTEIREFLDQWNRGTSTSPQHATLTAMLASDLRGARASLAAVNLLEKHFDGWKPSTDGTAPVFKNSDAAAEYRRLSQEMQVASAEYSRAGSALQALIRSAPQAVTLR
jgi:hypothetical protein